MTERDPRDLDDDGNGRATDDSQDCDCDEYDEDILTGQCICHRCGRSWYKDS